MGYGPEDYAGKPVIAIINTWSDINQCHAHFKERVEDVKRGVFQAGGFPLELPAISLSRAVRQAHDHALPQLPGHGDRGAAALAPGRRGGADGRLRQDHARPDHGRDLDEPAGDLRAGGRHAARQLARRRCWARARTAGSTGPSCRPARSPMQDWDEIESGIARSAGMCMTMGTAATMTAIAEALGFSLPGASSIPAPDAGHPRMCAEVRAADRRDGLGGPEAVRHHDGRRRRQRDPLPSGHGRLDQRHDPPRRHGAPRRHPARPRALRRAGAADPGAGQRPPVGQVPDGGLLLRRRHPRAAGRSSRTTLDLDCPHRQRPDAGREHRRRARSTTRGDPAARPSRSPRRRRRSSTATSRPTAR